MKKLLTAAAAFALSACGILAPTDEYKNAVPKAETVQMNVPGSTGQPLSGTGVTRSGLLGEQAQFYALTRGVTVFVNGAGYNVLTLVKTIVGYPATTSTDTGAVWGPWTDSLSPNTYRLTVTKVSDKNYSYALEGKGKNDADTAYVTVLSGSHATTGDNLGHGTFLLDMDAAQKLPEHDANSQGTAEYVYKHDTLDADTEVQAVFTQVKDHDTGRLVNASYHYLSNDTTGGSLDFQFQGDIDKDTAALENAAIESRWNRDGSGRSDVRVSGGDVPASTEVTASECWDSSFASRYMVSSFQTDAASNYGDVSACGNFSSAQFSQLRL